MKFVEVIYFSFLYSFSDFSTGDEWHVAHGMF